VRDSADAGPGPRFYTEFRYEGTPGDTIADFCEAARELLQRLASDLRSTSKGPFAPESTAEYEQLAAGVDRVMGHVEVFRRVASGEGAPPETARMMQSLVANVLADANAAEVARARARAPKAREAKFDQGMTGSTADEMKDYANKIKDAGEGIAKIAGSSTMEGLVDIAAAILEDIAIFGTEAAANTGGNEATRQIEEKLDYVMPAVDGLTAGQAAAADALRGIQDTASQTRADAIHIRAEVDSIEYKAERLGDLLGRTLVGSGWTVGGQLHPHTVSNVVPQRSIKEELHGLEGDVGDIINTLNVTVVNINAIVVRLKVIIQFIVNIFPANFFLFFSQFDEIRKAPPGTRPLIDERLKKIFVYAEDRFVPHSAGQRRTIDVRTPAFDLSGWIDLSDLRSGDVVEVLTSVTVAGRRRRLDRRRFDQPGLVPFADIARGLSTVSGSDVRIVIRQPVSADGYATPIELGYQFVVESQ